MSSITCDLPEAVKGTRFYREAEIRGQAWVDTLASDFAECGMTEGEDLAEYVDGLETWPSGLATYLTENGTDGIDPAIVAVREEWLTAYHTAKEGGADEATAWAAANAATDCMPGSTTETPIDTEAVKEAEKAEAEKKEAAQTEANNTLKRLVSAYRKGEREYRAGLLEAGRLCHRFVAQRIRLSATRKSAVQAIEGQLAAYATSTVDVDRMIRAAMAYDALVPYATDPVTDIPYGTWRDHYSRLVMRTAVGTAEESYPLLSGMEEACIAMFNAATSAKLDGKAIAGKVSDLVRSHTAAEETAAKTAAEAQRKEAAKAAESQQEAVKQRKEAERQAAEAERQAAEAKATADGDAEKLAHSQQLNAAAQEAAEELRTKQRKEIEANEKLAEESRLAAVKEKDRKAAERAAEAQAAKDRRSLEKAEKGQANRPQAPEAKQGTNLLGVAKAGTAKDVAGFAVELITGADNPDAVFALVLKELRDHNTLSSVSRQAVKSALLSLDRMAQHATVGTSRN